ncbi:putative phage-associated protein [Caulobacter sp. BE264]|uniref:Panacea domain-containing protein n=1 Tax=Caulobacter sp. BE264 TaxID=2817724 RepID=UPI002860C80A|nr:Panacea domain-containing protein [Caulobacter sp. BE264]MDR7232832.1 putative phage-associated protein [Caulobacter sp. BE264]
MKLKPNYRKILESILYLIGEGEKRGEPLTQYQIVKSIFLADTAHLNQFGRPITYDNYSALKFGPVPEETYDILKPNYDWQGRLGVKGPLWERVQVSQTAFRYVKPERSFDERALSKSDIKALAAALETVRELGFGGVVDHTHKHPAYVDAWGNGDAKRRPMKYALLFEEPDPEGAEHIAHTSAHI